MAKKHCRVKNEKIIIYQVLPRLFGNDTTHLVNNGSIEENGCGKLSSFTKEALAEIKRMGFNHIWYTGIIEHATQTDYSSYGIRKDCPAVVKGKAGSPYAIKDYYDIDPDLADSVPDRMKEFDALIERSHKAGLKVITDFVPNHVARQYFSDAKPDNIEDLGIGDNQNEAFSANNNFYYMPGQEFAPQFSLSVDGDEYREFPAKATGNDCFTPCPSVNDWYETVKLNYGVDYMYGRQPHFSPIPKTWEKMLDILLFWASKNIDGFRCDMAEMVPAEFWNWAISKVKERYPNVIFIAEVYNPNEYRHYLYLGKFDYLYDKVGLYDTLKDIVVNNHPAQNITQCWQSVDDIKLSMLNFLENHDEQRIASDFFAKDPLKALPAFVVSATMNKNPFMLYFGQELGEKGMDNEGFSGVDGRTTIFDYWSITSVRNWKNGNLFNEEKLTKKQKALRQYYVKVLQLCNESKAIREGEFYDLMYKNFNKETFNCHRQYAYMRYFEDELLLIVVNFDSCSVKAEVHIPSHIYETFGIGNPQIKSAIDLLSGKSYPAEINENCDYSVSLEGYGSVIIKFEI
ncbi:glycosidase [Dysgonomonadaceae bacterium PH5-43]|nr:glycosidase [Dysgonomonadaceae bacterium PH5-43]